MMYCTNTSRKIPENAISRIPLSSGRKFVLPMHNKSMNFTKFKNTAFWPKSPNLMHAKISNYIVFVIYNFLLSLVALPTTSITFLQSSMEPAVPPGPDNVVPAVNLSCTVANEGSFQWQWTTPPWITLSQMWVADGTRPSIVQISQISAANAGDYTCQT